jgi:hypothetical protein
MPITAHNVLFIASSPTAAVPRSKPTPAKPFRDTRQHKPRTIPFPNIHCFLSRSTRNIANPYQLHKVTDLRLEQPDFRFFHIMKLLYNLSTYFAINYNRTNVTDTSEINFDDVLWAAAGSPAVACCVLKAESELRFTHVQPITERTHQIATLCIQFLTCLLTEA